MTARINLFWTSAAVEVLAMTDCVTSECEKQRENLDYYSCQFSSHCEFFIFYAFWWWRWWSMSASILSSLSYQLHCNFFPSSVANLNSFLCRISMLSEISEERQQICCDFISQVFLWVISWFHEIKLLHWNWIDMKF